MTRSAAPSVACLHSYLLITCLGNNSKIVLFGNITVVEYSYHWFYAQPLKF